MAQENYNTFDFTPYESNFATGRREELADKTKLAYDTNKAEHDILKRTLGALETNTADAKYVTELNTDIDKTMKAVLDSGRYDLGNFAVSDSLTRFMTDNKVKNAVETFKMIKKEDQVNAANPNKINRYYEVPVMLDENQNEWTAADYKDPNKQGVAKLDANDNPIMKDLRQEHDSGVLGAYAGNSEEALDHVARATAMMKGIAKNSKFYTWIDAIANKYDVDDEEAARMIMTGEGVTRNRVEGLAEALVEEYGSTPEGLQRAYALSLKLSPNVEYYGKDPLMQLYSDEEIQQVLLNDLIAAGEPQIGETVNIRNIPQPASSGSSDDGTKRNLNYLNNTPANEIVGDLNKNFKKTKKAIKDGTSEIYDSNGRIKLQKVATSGPRGTTVKGTLDDPDSLTKAYERAVDTLKEQGSNNPLDIADEYQRTVYINTAFNYLKNDKDGNPIEVSDADFAYQIEKSLANAKSIQTIVYLPRTSASQKGSTSGTAQTAQTLIDRINLRGVLVYDEKLNPNQGTSLDQWDKLMDTELSGFGTWHSEGDAKTRLIKALANTAKGKGKDPELPSVSVGLTLRPSSPGATQVSYEDESGNSRTIYIKTEELSQTMLKPAAGLIEIALNPLEPMLRALPDIFNTTLTQKEKDAGVRTYISNELSSKGGRDAAGNKIPFSVEPKYFVYKGIAKADGTVTETSKPQYISQDKVNQFLHTAIKAYTVYGPDDATTYDDSEPDT